MQPLAQAKPARSQAQGALSGDVHGIRTKVRNGVCDLRAGEYGEADFRIAGTGDGAKPDRGDQANLMTEAAQALGGVRQRTHNAVGLRPPRISDEEDLHSAGIIA